MRGGGWWQHHILGLTEGWKLLTHHCGERGGGLRAEVGHFGGFAQAWLDSGWQTGQKAACGSPPAPSVPSTPSFCPFFSPPRASSCLLFWWVQPVHAFMCASFFKHTRFSLGKRNYLVFFCWLSTTEALDFLILLPAGRYCATEAKGPAWETESPSLRGFWR